MLLTIAAMQETKGLVKMCGLLRDTLLAFREALAHW